MLCAVQVAVFVVLAAACSADDDFPMGDDCYDSQAQVWCLEHHKCACFGEYMQWGDTDCKCVDDRLVSSSESSLGLACGETEDACAGKCDGGEEEVRCGPTNDNFSHKCFCVSKSGSSPPEPSHAGFPIGDNCYDSQALDACEEGNKHKCACFGEYMQWGENDCKCVDDRLVTSNESSLGLACGDTKEACESKCNGRNEEVRCAPTNQQFGHKCFCVGRQMVLVV
eukprot:TRINITY_DN73515_c0_g1_i1.p3 TRINITY_DN73515_c0_g1~~TRINITY_DN73515_c0_g1_i1.p3  ORF type:complete len:225 (-),score=49.85 TRINITY_DN73515_c0_g1_i1:115-789(-)